MKKILLCTFLSVASFAHAQKNRTLTCKDFRIGDFVIIDSESKIKLKIHREKTFQTETPYNLETGKVIDDTEKLNIKWVDDCTYVLSSTKKQPDDIEQEVMNKGGIYVHITSINVRTATLSSTIGKERVKPL